MPSFLPPLNCETSSASNLNNEGKCSNTIVPCNLFYVHSTVGSSHQRSKKQYRTRFLEEPTSIFPPAECCSAGALWKFSYFFSGMFYLSSVVDSKKEICNRSESISKVYLVPNSSKTVTLGICYWLALSELFLKAIIFCTSSFNISCSNVSQGKSVLWSCLKAWSPTAGRRTAPAWLSTHSMWVLRMNKLGNFFSWIAFLLYKEMWGSTSALQLRNLFTCGPHWQIRP